MNGDFNGAKLDAPKGFEEPSDDLLWLIGSACVVCHEGVNLEKTLSWFGFVRSVRGSLGCKRQDGYGAPPGDSESSTPSNKRHLSPKALRALGLPHPYRVSVGEFGGVMQIEFRS